MPACKGINFDVFGVNVRLEYSESFSPELIGAIELAWDSARAADGPGDVQLTLELDDQDQLLQRLSTQVTLAALEYRSGGPLMFHAAGISDSDGRVIAFVGPSGRGKTTLSRTLAREFSYVSDETLVVEDDLSVRAYRKPLSLKRPELPKQQVSPRALGLLDLPDAPLRLHKLVVLDRQPQVSAPSIERVSMSDAFVQIVPETSYLTRMDQPLRRFAKLCNDAGGVFKVTYSEAESLIQLAPQLFQLGFETIPWESVLPPMLVSQKSVLRMEEEIRRLDEASESRSKQGVYSVAEVLDAIEIEAKILLLAKDGMLRILDGIGPTIWYSALDGASFAELTQAVLTSHGEPPSGDIETELAQVLDELVHLRVLRLS